jgi:uncharacterized metal-binding protein
MVTRAGNHLLQPKERVMSDTKGCTCSGAPTLIFACSGAADVGAIADQTARKLTREGKGKMFCLAGIGGRISGIMASTKAAEKILAIDGCPLNCVKACLDQAGIAGFSHLQLADLGMAKGKSPCDEPRISQAYTAACDKLQDCPSPATTPNQSAGCSCK